jgi:hypothetical protein
MIQQIYWKIQIELWKYVHCWISFLDTSDDFQQKSQIWGWK